MARTVRRTPYVKAGKTAAREPRPQVRRTGTRAAIVAAALKGA